MKLTFRYLAYLIIVITLPVYASEDLTYPLLQKNFETYKNKISLLQSNLDRKVFDDQEILIANDFDAQQIISFVREKIVFQSYPGLLRGVQGTLNSRAGNSLDQSILLAKMLKDAGYEARIARGELSKEQALILIRQISNASIPKNIGNGEDFNNVISTLAKKNTNSNAPFDWKKTNTFKRYQKSSVRLQDILRQYEIELAEVDITEKLVNENKDYFWVQYRMGVTDPWINTHPSFINETALNLEIKESFKDNIPERYLHQIKIESFIEQRIGDNYKTHSLMKAWKKPAANLQGVFLSYANMPLGIDIKADFKMQDIINRSQVFMPTFNGQAVGGKVFDLQGRLVESDAMSAPAAGIFKTVGDKTMNAIDALEDNKKPKLELTAQWLQFTFISPDGKERVVKRYTYKADKNKTEEENSVKTQLLTRYEMMVNTGEQPLAYLAELYLQSVENSLPWLKASIDKLFSEKKQGAFPKSIPESSFDLLIQSRWMSQRPNIPPHTIQYISEPNLIAFKKGFVDFQKEFFAVDIISNSRKFLRVENGKVYNDTKQTFNQGIWDTAGEWLPSRFLNLEGNEVDTLRVTSAAETQNISLRLLKPGTGVEKNLANIFSKDSLAYEAAMADINSGYSLIIPEKKPANMKMSGWWRFNTMTGESLGMTADGGGQEVTEYMIENAQIALMLVRSLGNLQKCHLDESLNNFEKMCCLAEAHFNNVAGLSFGGALAGSLGTAGAAVFDIVDFTHELGTGSGIAPGTNGAVCKAVGPIPDF